MADHEPAVFARNFAKYLEEARRINASAPARLVTFRSRVPWATARQLLADFGPFDIFFAENDGDGRVTYQARLREVHLRPRKSDPTTRRLLLLRPPGTLADRGWKDGEGTYYAISHCRRVKAAFPQTALVKLSDDQPIHRDYSRSYCLVAAPDGRTLDDLYADDLAPPRRTRSVVVRRIVRDTAMVKRVKRLHKNKCQLCRVTLRLLDGTAYSEGHHLRPLGGAHIGPDTPANILVVCPNCHARLDMLGVTVSRSALARRSGHTVGASSVEYHNRLVVQARGR